MTLTEFNTLPAVLARQEFLRCCESVAWASKMMEKRPFASNEELFRTAVALWTGLKEADWLEAFAGHPKIGDVKSLAKKFSSISQWASGEQSGVGVATDDLLQRLAEGNTNYEKRFGFIFIVCATGKSAVEMLDLLDQRLPNARDVELRIAVGEQEKIMKLRLEKLLAS